MSDRCPGCGGSGEVLGDYGESLVPCPHCYEGWKRKHLEWVAGLPNLCYCFTCLEHRSKERQDD